MRSQSTDDIVTGVLDRMERHERTTKIAIIGAAALEGLLMVIAVLKLDWRDPTQVLMFLFAILGYTIIALGLVAVGAHVSRVGARVVAALEDQSTG